VGVLCVFGLLELAEMAPLSSTQQPPTNHHHPPVTSRPLAKMPSLIICGHPCTSKTTFANLLSARALSHPSALITSVTHITESTACPDTSKAECYQNSHNEKITRAALKSEFDQAITKNESSTLVLLDSLNYIKGYRYELYCISKAAGERHGTVWITGSSDELAKQRNRRRKELINPDDNDGHYQDDEVMDDLVLRFEPPDERNRWENPLYTVDLSRVLPWDANGTLETSNGSVKEAASQMQSLTIQDDTTKEVKPIKTASGFKRNKKTKPRAAPSAAAQPTITQAETPSGPMSMASRNLTASSNPTDSSIQTIEQIIDQILQSFLIKTQPLKEGMSTALHANAESNALNRVDATSQRINNEILRLQKIPSDKISIPLGEKQCIFVLNEALNANELRNYRRQFLKWTSSHPMEDGISEEEIGENYVKYIETLIGGKGQINL
jgi:protein KTI12